MKKGASIRLTFFHAALVLLSLVFSLPFLWMLSTSFKADDEIIHDPMVWIPELPNRVTHSPYLDSEAHPPRWERPMTLPKNVNWKTLQSDLRSAIRKRANAIFKSSEWTALRDNQEPALFASASRDVEDLLWEAVRQRISDRAWSEPGVVERVVAKIEPVDVLNAWRRLYRTLAIGAIHLRNSSARDIGMSPKPAHDRLYYDIEDREKALLLSERIVDIASPEEKVDQVMVRVKGDASYHRLAVELEADGKVCRTEKPGFLSSGEYQDVFLKFKPQVNYEIEHLRLIPDDSRKSGLPSTQAILRFYLLPTPYPTVLWQRLTENYQEVFHWVPYATYMWVTVKLTFLNIVGQLFACSLVAFAFARMQFPGRNVLFVLMLSTMMLPPQVTMIPQFVEFSKIGAYNTLFPLYVFSFAGAPFFIFLMRQFYLTIPRDLTDAAKIDGCGYFTTYWRIMLPLVKPALAAIAIFQFQATWNEFLQPLIYITDTDKTPISVGLFLFRQSHGEGGGGYWAELMAASSLMTVPIILLFFFTQRYFIQGVTLTGMKG